MTVMMALIRHEFAERLRDRWVAVSTVLFALLAAGISAYGGGAEDAAAAVTVPSLATLSAFLVPLVALVLGYDAIVGERERHTLGLLLSLPVQRWQVVVGKYIGRSAALFLSTALGLGVAAALLPPGQRALVWVMLPSTMLLGAAFLSVGVWLSVVARRQSTAASLAVAVWFLLVFFYDLGLLAAMVASDGAIPEKAISWLVVLNPAGLYRSGMLAHLVGTVAVEDLGMTIVLPSLATRAGLWAAWILAPLAAASRALHGRGAVTS